MGCRSVSSQRTTAVFLACSGAKCCRFFSQSAAWCACATLPGASTMVMWRAGSGSWQSGVPSSSLSLSQRSQKSGIVSPSVSVVLSLSSSVTTAHVPSTHSPMLQMTDSEQALPSPAVLRHLLVLASQTSFVAHGSVSLHDSPAAAVIVQTRARHVPSWHCLSF